MKYNYLLMDILTYDEWYYICSYLDLRDYNSMIYVSKWFKFIASSFIDELIGNTIIDDWSDEIYNILDVNTCRSRVITAGSISLQLKSDVGTVDQAGRIPSQQKSDVGTVDPQKSGRLKYTGRKHGKIYALKNNRYCNCCILAIHNHMYKAIFDKGKLLEYYEYKIDQHILIDSGESSVGKYIDKMISTADYIDKMISTDKYLFQSYKDGNLIRYHRYSSTKYVYVLKPTNIWYATTSLRISKNDCISITKYKPRDIYDNNCTMINRHWKDNINTVYCNGKRAYSYRDGKSKNKFYYQSYNSNKTYKVGKRVSKRTDIPRDTFINGEFNTYRQYTRIVKTIKDGKLIETKCYQLMSNYLLWEVKHQVVYR